jgi:hypothetical protein
VSALKRFLWRSKERRYVLEVLLTDPTLTIKARFSEDELARLLGNGSEAHRGLGADARDAAEAAVAGKLKGYEGVLVLRLGAADADPSPSGTRALPEILRRDAAPDETAVLRDSIDAAKRESHGP